MIILIHITYTNIKTKKINLIFKTFLKGLNQNCQTFHIHLIIKPNYKELSTKETNYKIYLLQFTCPFVSKQN